MVDWDMVRTGDAPALFPPDQVPPKPLGAFAGIIAGRKYSYADSLGKRWAKPGPSVTFSLTRKTLKNKASTTAVGGLHKVIVLGANLRLQNFARRCALNFASRNGQPKHRVDNSITEKRQLLLRSMIIPDNSSPQ
jgi:hypothetical protein